VIAPGVAKPALEGTPAGGRLPSTLEVEAIEEEEGKRQAQQEKKASLLQPMRPLLLGADEGELAWC